MKAAVCILTTILLLLMVQPLFSNSCAEPAESSCSKSKCNKPEPAKENDDCENNRCNPLMACPTGNFYLFGHSHISIALLLLPKQKTILVNDNRVSAKLTECWHPPENIS